MEKILGKKWQGGPTARLESRRPPGNPGRARLWGLRRLVDEDEVNDNAETDGGDDNCGHGKSPKEGQKKAGFKARSGLLHDGDQAFVVGCCVPMGREPRRTQRAGLDQRSATMTTMTMTTGMEWILGSWLVGTPKGGAMYSLRESRSTKSWTRFAILSDGRRRDDHRCDAVRRLGSRGRSGNCVVSRHPRARPALSRAGQELTTARGSPARHN